MAISRSSTELEYSEENLTGPGRRLREARLARNLDLEEIAAHLRLNLSVVERIEADDYDNLPAPTFVRGYLRGYARMLNMDPEHIVDAYNLNEFGPPPLVRDISKAREVKSTDFSFRLTTYLIITVVAVLVAIWWQNQDSGTPRTTTEDLSTSSISSPAPDVVELPATQSENVVSNTVTEITPSLPVAEAVTTPVIVTIPDVTPNAVAGVEDPTATATPVPADETDADAVAADVLAAVANDRADNDAVTEVPPPPTIEAVPPVPVPETAAPAPTPVLRISVGQESWVEVYGEDDSRLYYDLARAGATIEIVEPGPLRVLLGNTTDVRVEYNGAPFDIAPHSDAGVARFSLTP